MSSPSFWIMTLLSSYQNMHKSGGLLRVQVSRTHINFLLQKESVLLSGDRTVPCNSWQSEEDEVSMTSDVPGQTVGRAKIHYLKIGPLSHQKKKEVVLMFLTKIESQGQQRCTGPAVRSIERTLGDLFLSLSRGRILCFRPSFMWPSLISSKSNLQSPCRSM